MTSHSRSSAGTFSGTTFGFARLFVATTVPDLFQGTFLVHLLLQPSKRSVDGFTASRLDFRHGVNHLSFLGLDLCLAAFGPQSRGCTRNVLDKHRSPILGTKQPILYPRTEPKQVIHCTIVSHPVSGPQCTVTEKRTYSRTHSRPCARTEILDRPEHSTGLSSKVSSQPFHKSSALTLPGIQI